MPPPSDSLTARFRRTASFLVGAVGIVAIDPFGVEFRHWGFDAAILETTEKLRPDVVVLRSFFAHLAPEIQHLGARVVADIHDASPLMARVLEADSRRLSRSGLALRRRAGEKANRSLGRVDELWVPSHRELKYFRSRLSGVYVLLVPNGVEVSATSKISPPSDELLLVANFGWPPNLAAADTLVERVLPLVRARRPQAHATLVGRDLPPDRLERWADAPVRWEGAVAHVTPYFRRAGALVFLPPSSAQTPMPLKVAEALSWATPVVLSDGSTGGFPLRRGEDAIVTDDPVEAARAIAELLSDRQRRERIGLAGHRWARDHLSRQAIRSVIERESIIVRGYDHTWAQYDDTSG